MNQQGKQKGVSVGKKGNVFLWIKKYRRDYDNEVCWDSKDWDKALKKELGL